MKYKLFKNQGLGKLTARTRYYLESHRRRYGSYQEVSGACGEFTGIRWVGSL